MSRDLVTYVEVYDAKNNVWKELNLFTNDGKRVDLFDNEARDIILNNDDENIVGYLRGLPTGFTKYDEWEDYDSYCTYFDWCELQALARTPEAEVIDWDKMEEEPEKYENVTREKYPRYNALKNYVDTIFLLLNAYGHYYMKPGEARVVCCLSF